MQQLILLGGATIRDDDGPVTGTAARRHPLAILALLATAAGCTLSRSKLVGLLWPESTEKAARHRLNTALHTLRRVLGDDALQSIGDDVRLDRSALEVDVHRFREALEQDDHETAVTFYGGPFLDGFRLGGSAAFEHRVDRTRAELRHEYLDALEVLAAVAESRGEAEAATRWWQERFNQDPLDSRVTLRLMRAVAAAGNRAAALRVADQHAERMAEEIGVEAPPEVREMADRLQVGETVTFAALDPGDAPEGTHGGENGADPDSSTGEVASSTAPGPSAEQPAPEPVLLAVRHGPGRLAAVLLLILATATATAWVLGTADPPSPEPGIAVMPFQTLGASEPSAFTQGVYWDVLTDLAAAEGLEVISPTSVEQLRNPDGPLPRIADRLGVGWVVRGEVQETGGRVQVNVRLMDARRDRQVWAGRYSRGLPESDPLALQREMTREIAAALAGELGGEAGAAGNRPPSGDLQAYTSYVQGRSQLAERTPAGVHRAEAHFRRALELDSLYAHPWLGLALAALQRSSFGYSGGREHTADPRYAIARALELAPTFPEARAFRAWIDLPLREAVTELREVVAEEPNNAAIHHWLGQRARQIGYLEESVHHLEQAARLDPLSAGVHATLSGSYYFAGRFEEALEQSRLAQELSAGWTEARIGEGMALLALDRPVEAVDLLDATASELSAQSVFRLPTLSFLGAAQARIGDTLAARETLAGLPAGPLAGLWRAIIHVQLGELDAATVALEDARITRPQLPMLRYSPLLEPFRSTDAYPSVLSRALADLE